MNSFAAGKRYMNPSLYSKPNKRGQKNKSFKHPNLQSNLVFYETSPNMKEVESSRFTTTSNVMQSLRQPQNQVDFDPNRLFMINGKLAERITRHNNANVKNRSCFELSHARKKKKDQNKSCEVTSRNNNKSVIIQEITEQSHPEMNIWEYRNSPYKKPKSKKSKCAKVKPQFSSRQYETNPGKNSQNVFKIANNSHRMALESRNAHNKSVEQPSQKQKNSPMKILEPEIAPQGQQKKKVEDKRYSFQPETPPRAQKLDFYGKNSPEVGTAAFNDIQNTVVCDLRDEISPQPNQRQNFDEEYVNSVVSDAFERHQEWQEKERFKRYVTDFRKEMKMPKMETSPYQAHKDIMCDQITPRTNGVTLDFSGDPMQHVHKQKTKLRGQVLDLCYKDTLQKQNVKTHKEGKGTSIDLKPDLKYTQIKNLCDLERRNGIISQIREKSYREDAEREHMREEQEKFNRHWDNVNKKADQIEKARRIKEANIISEEMHRAEAKRLREYAEKQIEKERQRKINQKLAQRRDKADENKKRQAREIKRALEELMRQKREEIMARKGKQKLVINSCKKNVISTPKPRGMGY